MMHTCDQPHRRREPPRGRWSQVCSRRKPSWIACPVGGPHRNPAPAPSSSAGSLHGRSAVPATLAVPHRNRPSTSMQTACPPTKSGTCVSNLAPRHCHFPRPSARPRLHQRGRILGHRHQRPGVRLRPFDPRLHDPQHRRSTRRPLRPPSMMGRSPARVSMRSVFVDWRDCEGSCGRERLDCLCARIVRHDGTTTASNRSRSRPPRKDPPQGGIRGKGASDEQQLAFLQVQRAMLP